MTAPFDRQALQRLRQRAWDRLLAGCASPALQAAVCAHLPQHAALGAAFVAGDVAARPFGQGVQP